MRRALIPILLLAGCSGPPRPEAPPSSASVEPARITQLYVTVPRIHLGEKSLLCYGVENAASVRLSPAEQTLTVTPSRCVDVTPAKTTTYTVTATGRDGKPVSQSATVEVLGPRAPRARIIEVRVSALEVKPGDLVEICFSAQNARAVRIDPIGPYTQSTTHGCVREQVMRTKTYTVVATGAEGESDREQVTVKVTSPRG